MDGTGLLFEPLISRAPAHIHIKPISLRQLPDVGYVEQAEHILNQIHEAPTTIVAESYSGRIAYELAHKFPTNIKHIVFAASFLGRPSTRAKFAPIFPLRILTNGILPRSVIGHLAFGGASSDRLVELLDKSLSETDNQVLRYRLGQIAKLEAPTKPITTPCTYIRPRGDHFVRPAAMEVFRDICPNLMIRELEGSHFILQTNPTGCWEIIQDILQELSFR